ncbi:MAG TPA: RNA 2',3'-cyclic phosphodiesterase [Polyangiaceae bacterium]|jgi:2'-5' RNA ligase
MIRAFVALDLDAASLAQVTRLSSALRGGAPARAHFRWSDVAQMHLTSKFLGSVSEETIAALAREVTALGHRAAPRSHTRSLTGFPSPQRARVLVVELDDPSGALAGLASELEVRAESFGVPRETRAYAPHVTLARARDPLALSPWLDAVPFAPQPLRFEALTLYQSDTTATGAHYTALARAPFH